MKKIFTLALAAAAAMSVSAAVDQTPVMYGERADMVNFNYQKAHTSNPIVVESRADEVPDLAGTYVNQNLMIFPNDAQDKVLGTIMQKSNDFEIVADPDVENGYIVKNYLHDFFFGSDGPEKVNDLKGYYNPLDGHFYLNPGQVICTFPFKKQDGSEELVDLTFTFVDMNQMFNDTDPIPFDLYVGQLRMSDLAYYYCFLKPTTTPDGKKGFYGLSCWIADNVMWVPNGTFDYFGVQQNQNLTCPIFGVNAGGKTYIYNFGDLDMFHGTPFFRVNDEQNLYYTSVNPADPETPIPAAQLIMDYPEMNPNFNINTLYYLTEVDPAANYEPVTEPEVFEIMGDVVESSDEEWVVELPACGLLTLTDLPWNYYDGVTMTYNPNCKQLAQVGLSTVAAENTDAPVVYYNLQGMRVANPQAGVFIRCQGNKVSKVLVK